MKNYLGFIVLILIENTMANNNENLHKNLIKRQVNEVPFNDENPMDLIKLKKQNTSDLIEMHTYTRLNIPKNSIGILMLNNIPLFGKNFENFTSHTNFKLNNLENNQTNSLQTKLISSDSMKSTSDINSLLESINLLPSSLQLSPSTSSLLTPSLSHINNNYLENYIRNIPISKPSSFFSPLYYHENNYRNEPYWFKPNNNIPKPTKPSPLHLLIEKLNESNLQIDNESNSNTNNIDDNNSMEINNDDNQNIKRGSLYYNKNYEYNNIMPTLFQKNDNQFDLNDFGIYNSRNNFLRKSYDTTNPYGFRKFLPSVSNNNIIHNNNIPFSIPIIPSSQLSTSRMQTDLSSYTNKLNPFNIRSDYDYSIPPLLSKQYPLQYTNKPSNIADQTLITPISGSYLKYPSYLNRFELNNDRRELPFNFKKNYSQEPIINTVGNGNGSPPLISDLKNSLKELKSKIAEIRQYMENKNLQEEIA